MTAHIISHPNAGKEAFKNTFDIFKNYAEIILPATKKPDKLKDMPPSERNKLKETLQNLKKSWGKIPDKT